MAVLKYGKRFKSNCLTQRCFFCIKGSMGEDAQYILDILRSKNPKFDEQHPEVVEALERAKQSLQEEGIHHAALYTAVQDSDVERALRMIKGESPYSSEETARFNEIRHQIIDFFNSYAHKDAQLEGGVDGVLNKFNEDIGKYLPDDIPLIFLRFPTESKRLKFSGAFVPSEPDPMYVEKTNSINRKVRREYNTLVDEALLHNLTGTLGEFRAKPREKVEAIGATQGPRLYNLFRRG